MTDAQNTFEKPVTNNLKTYHNIHKIETVQGDG